MSKGPGQLGWQHWSRQRLVPSGSSLRPLGESYKGGGKGQERGDVIEGGGHVGGGETGWIGAGLQSDGENCEEEGKELRK